MIRPGWSYADHIAAVFAVGGAYAIFAGVVVIVALGRALPVIAGAMVLYWLAH